MAEAEKIAELEAKVAPAGPGRWSRHRHGVHDAQRRLENHRNCVLSPGPARNHRRLSEATNLRGLTAPLGATHAADRPWKRLLLRAAAHRTARVTAPDAGGG